MKKQIVKSELKSNESGITLLTLVIMLVVMLILLSVATYSGLQVVNMSKVKKFTTEMEILQSQINKLSSEKGTFDEDDGEVVESGSIHYQDLSNRLNLVSEYGYGNSEEDMKGYRYFTPDELINDLGIEGVDQTVFINLKKKKAISYDGVKDKGKKVYVLEQVSSDLYVVDYKGMDTSTKPTFDVTVTDVGNEKWNVQISNIEFTEEINKWTVQYKLEDAENWSTSNTLDFVVDATGNYIVKIENGDIQSEEQTFTIEAE